MLIPGRTQAVQDHSIQLGLGRSDTIKIWKVFGDIPSCSYHLHKRVAHVQEHNDLRNVLEGTRVRDILMVGFDPVWDGDIVSTLFPRTASPHSFWYINDQKLEEGSALAQYLEDCRAKCISGEDGNHENFFQRLRLHMMGKIAASYQIEEDLHLELRQVKEELASLREVREELASLRGVREELASLREEVRRLNGLFQGENGRKPAEQD